MQSNKILNNPSKILTKNQREEYFEEGGVKIDEVLNKASDGSNFLNSV